MGEKCVALENVKNILSHLAPAKSWVVAYSGGLDSHVLLHIMAQLQKENAALKIHAVHVNHQIHPAANQWEKHCEYICRELSVPFSAEKITLNLKPGDSLEEEARVARYAVLKKYLDANTVLLTAHTCNDQAETFLLQAMRGAGSKGLSAMPVKKKLGVSYLIRPLLSVTRAVLERYARENNLHWIEDESNADSRFDRNFLRHNIFPLLKTRRAAIVENFARSAKLIAMQEKIIAEVITHDFETIKTDDPKKIDSRKLSEFSDEKQTLLLREWFAQNHLRLPNEKHIKQIQQAVVQARSDAKPIFCLGTISIRRQRGCLLLC